MLQQLTEGTLNVLPSNQCFQNDPDLLSGNEKIDKQDCVSLCTIYVEFCNSVLFKKYCTSKSVVLRLNKFCNQEISIDQLPV